MTLLPGVVAVVMAGMLGVQVVDGDGRKFANTAVDFFTSCKANKASKPTGKFFIILESFASWEVPETFRVDTSGFTYRKYYTIIREGDASLERSGSGFVLSFQLSVKDFNQPLQYTYTIKSTTTGNKETGTMNVRIGKNSGSYKIKISKKLGWCKCEVIEDGERIDQCTATVTNVSFFKSYSSLKDQMTFWVGNDHAKDMVERFYKTVVLDRLKQCLPQYQTKLCELFESPR